MNSWLWYLMESTFFFNQNKMYCILCTDLPKWIMHCPVFFLSLIVSWGNFSQCGWHLLHHPSVHITALWRHHARLHVQWTPSHPTWCWRSLLHWPGWGIFQVSTLQIACSKTCLLHVNNSEWACQTLILQHFWQESTINRLTDKMVRWAIHV